MFAAPAVHTRRKSREVDETRMITLAAWVWRDTPIWVPVIVRGHVVGEVRGDPTLGRSLYRRCSTGVPFVSDDDAVRNLSTNLKHWAIYWYKPTDTGIVIDNWYDLWGCDGVPQKGDWSGTARTARKFLNTTNGALCAGTAVSPSLKYLTRASQFNYGTIKAYVIYDRVLSYDACTMTAGSQAMTNTNTATRYISSGDPGLQVFIEADTVHNATAANLTVLTYTDQSGNTGHTVVTSPTLSKIASVAAPTSTLGARCVIQTPGAATKNMNPYLTLAAGDQGVRAIADYTWSAAPTGTNSFVLQFPLALFIDSVIAGQVGDWEFVSGIEALGKRVYDDACLSVMTNPHVTAQPATNHGWMEFAWT